MAPDFMFLIAENTMIYSSEPQSQSAASVKKWPIESDEEWKCPRNCINPTTVSHTLLQRYIDPQTSEVWSVRRITLKQTCFNASPSPSPTWSLHIHSALTSALWLLFLFIVHYQWWHKSCGMGLKYVHPAESLSNPKPTHSWFVVFEVLTKPSERQK